MKLSACLELAEVLCLPRSGRTDPRNCCNCSMLIAKLEIVRTGLAFKDIRVLGGNIQFTYRSAGRVQPQLAREFTFERLAANDKGNGTDSGSQLSRSKTVSWPRWPRRGLKLGVRELHHKA